MTSDVSVLLTHLVLNLIASVFGCTWCHQMETFSALLAPCAGNSPVTGEFPAQRPVTRSFDVFFDLRLNKWLSKQLRHRWFEKPSHSSWRHCSCTCNKLPDLVVPVPDFVMIYMACNFVKYIHSYRHPFQFCDSSVPISLLTHWPLEDLNVILTM